MGYRNKPDNTWTKYDPLCFNLTVNEGLFYTKITAREASRSEEQQFAKVLKRMSSGDAVCVHYKRYGMWNKLTEDSFYVVGEEGRDFHGHNFDSQSIKNYGEHNKRNFRTWCVYTMVAILTSVSWIVTIPSIFIFDWCMTS